MTVYSVQHFCSLEIPGYSIKWSNYDTLNSLTFFPLNTTSMFHIYLQQYLGFCLFVGKLTVKPSQYLFLGKFKLNFKMEI